MKVYSLNPISIHQQDDKMNYHIPATVSPGMHHETATKIAEAPQEVFETAVQNMVKSEAIHQKKESDENNLYSRNVNFEKRAELTNPNLKEIINPDQPDVREYVENGNATIYEAAGRDDEVYYELPIHNKKLYIYSRPMHEIMKGGKIEPEQQSNSSELVEAGGDLEGIAFNDGQGVSFSEGIAYNDSELDKIINGLNKSGGALPALVGELALQIIPQIPAIISAIKAKRDQSKIGNGLLGNMQKYETVRAIMNNLPENKQAGFYNDIIREFNALKRIGKGISFNASDNCYYASGKFSEGIKKFWNFIKTKYNENKSVFEPIRNALVNAATNSLQKGVTAATNKATDYVKSKTGNTDIHNIVDSVAQVAQTATDAAKKQIAEVGKGIEAEKIYSVLN